MIPYYIGGMVFGFLFAVISEWAGKRLKYPGRTMRVLNVSIVALSFSMMFSLFVTALALHIASVFWWGR